ncbi:MAG: GerAB/ArcD/ProY family transporter, partial [Clostridiales bacterium]|nr:GerAB/ArcD/ProY family transporter [Clostridiales bacterium]
TIRLFVTPKQTEKTERYLGRYYALWVFGTVGFNFIVYFFAIASMGEYLQTQAFPIFAYSQLADLGPIERLDSLHTSIWLIAVFLKTALLLVCADKCLKFLLPRTNRAAVSAGSAGITLAISLFIANSFENYINT